MSLPHPDQSFIEHLLELMAGLGPVKARRMFGGHGLFMHGLMFALVAEQTLYLKVDPLTRELFTDRGLNAFTYFKQGKPYQLSYYQAPEETLESADDMCQWAESSYAVAVRAGKNKP